MGSQEGCLLPLHLVLSLSPFILVPVFIEPHEPRAASVFCILRSLAMADKADLTIVTVAAFLSFACGVKVRVFTPQNSAQWIHRASLNRGLKPNIYIRSIKGRDFP